MSDLPNPEGALFAAALELPAAQRGAYLEQACGGNTDLRQQVEGLLQVHDEASNFFDKLTPVARPTYAEGVMSSSSETICLSEIPAEKTCDHIGRYRLLQQIGEGGCGVVYLAEQEEPVRRNVALKIIKLGMDTKSVVARFEVERQALALMDHPSIARVLDAGTTDMGRPYIVMELVQGLKITDYCDKNNLPTRQRLQLFIQVCQAIQHAHQKGIIHRDIKPSNVLVSLRDGVPVPKVIDFGIAKATTDQRLTDKTLFTAFDQFVGTPVYMSPEQAAMSELGIDTRSDIYSLGVLLYELLTGRTPFDSQILQRVGLDEIRRIIREEEPARPSTRVSTLAGAELTNVARHRRIEPAKLSGLIRGELDWIVMKALEKDRRRRYETANGLATDVQRHLADQPIVARPSSNLYRLQKLVRRHKVTFGAAMAITVALVIGAVISASEAIRARRAEREQVRLREQAQLEAERSRQVAQFLKDMLQGVGPSVAAGRDATMLREILDKTARRVGQDLTNEPIVETDLQTTIGEVYELLGEYDKAEAVDRQALEIRRKLWGHEHPAVAESLHNLARILGDEGKPVQAIAMHREALGLRRKLLGKADPALAESLQDLALALQTSDQHEAESLMREALAIDLKVWNEGDPRLAQPLGILALLLDASKLEEAETLARQAVAIERRSPEGQPHGLAESLRHLAQVLADDKDNLGQAEDAARESLALTQKLRKDQAPVIADSLNVLSWVLYKRAKLDGAETAARDALAIQRGRNPSDPEIQWALNTLCLTLEREGRWKEAVPYFSQLVQLEPSNSYLQRVLAILLIEIGDLPGYRAQCQKMVAVFGASLDPAALDATAEACALAPGGFSLDDASKLADRAVTLGKNTGSMLHLGLVQYRRSQFASASEWVGKVIEAGKNASDLNCDLAAYAVLAMAQHQSHHPAEARAALARGFEISRKMPQLESGDLGEDAEHWLAAHILLREANGLIEHQ